VLQRSNDKVQRVRQAASAEELHNQHVWLASRTTRSTHRIKPVKITERDGEVVNVVIVVSRVCTVG
jgi:hypothetical protein